VTVYPRAFLAIVLFTLAAAAPVAAQQQAGAADPEVDPTETARFRFGPLRFTPSIALTNLGVDTNVFNDANNPKQDKVGTFGPATDLWMHFGRSLLSGKTSVQYLYFDQYDSQRAWNSAHWAKWEVPLARLTPFVEGAYSNSRNRAGYEIDSRIRLIDQSVGVGTEVALSSQTRLVLSAARMRTAYDDRESALAAEAATALNRWSNVERMQLRYKLTPLTTFVVDAEAVQDRFASETIRNTDSISVLPGFVMKPSALISGRVSVGFRNFTPLQAALIPPYRGPVAVVDATYILRATRFGVKVGRDVVFSSQAQQPYYVLTDATVLLTQRLTYTWDVVLQAGRQVLDYTAITTSLASADPQVDTINQYGGGVGYRLGRMFRFGVDSIYFRRRSSNVALRDFEGLRVGASITYGLPQ